MGRDPAEEPEEPNAPRNPWNAGSVEWLQEIPGRPWGVRTIPRVETRYPLWEQPGIIADYDAGRFYLPDAEEGRREMLVTSTIDAEPIQCMRIAGPTFITLIAAICVAGIFIFPTFKLYWWMGVSVAVSIVVIWIWLWTGSAEIPEKHDQGRRPRHHLAALRIGTRFGRLVGDVHHHARHLQRLRLAGVRLLLLLVAA